MGHERVGYLPKTKKWRTLVGELSASAHADHAVSRLSENTIAAIGQRYLALAKDPAVAAAFEYLLELARAKKPSDLSIVNRGPLALSIELDEKLPKQGSLETRSLAHKAAVEAVLKWQSINSPPWAELFASEAPAPALQGINTAGGFAELSRLFFASLTTRYLKYFLEREASAVIPHITSREAFNQNLNEHIDGVSRYAFETTKIAQSYAAGWFNKYGSKEAKPSREQIRRFLSYAFSKLREDLRRSGSE